MKIIEIEKRIGLTCHTCGTNKSVKYNLNGMNFCNKCIYLAQSVINAEQISKDK